MNKIILSIFFVILSANYLNAQTQFGSSIGFNQSFRKGDVLNGNDDPYIGFSIGFFSKIKISEKFYFQPEFNYVNYKYYSDQIQIPILAKYEIIDKFDIFAGPDFGFLLYKTQTTDPFNLALTLGLSYDISKHFSIDLRYNFGITELKQINFLEGDSMRLNSLQIGLKYIF